MDAASFRALIVVTLAATIIPCVPVEATPELENQDTAFSLLIERCGEAQSAFIQNDYQTRLAIAESVADPVARRHAFDLAKQERDLRVTKLKRQLTEMAVAYHYSHQPYERDTGAAYPRNSIQPLPHKV